MKHLARVVSKAGQMSSVFFARDNFRILSLNDIKNLNCFIFARRYDSLSLVVKVKGRDVGVLMLRKLESLN